MNPIRTFAAVAILAAVVLVAWLSLRTTADQPTISQPETTTPQATATEMPTPTPVPTSTPTPIPVLRTATTPEDIAGIWQYCIPSTPDDCYAYQYRKDGTYRGAAILSEERFENSPSVIGEFWFEGTQLHLNVLEDTLTEVWSCIGDLGIYEVQLLEDGALRFDLVDDPCPVRSEDLSQFAHYPVTLEE